MNVNDFRARISEIQKSRETPDDKWRQLGALLYHNIRSVPESEREAVMSLVDTAQAKVLQQKAQAQR